MNENRVHKRLNVKRIRESMHRHRNVIAVVLFMLTAAMVLTIISAIPEPNTEYLKDTEGRHDLSSKDFSKYALL